MTTYSRQATGPLACERVIRSLGCGDTSAGSRVGTLERLMSRILPVVLLVVACDPDRGESNAGAGTGSFALATCELPAVADCEGCLDFELAHRLGETGDDPGFLVGVTSMLRVVRDPRGRYWIGQGEEIKVFDADGAFVAKVGRAGEGPLEFSAVRLIGVDSNGRVHVLDNRNKRVTALNADFTLADETSVPGGFVRDMVMPSRETSTSGRYVLQTWISSLDRVGLALHRLGADGRIVSSFGPRPTSASGPMTPMLMRRELALHSNDTVLSASLSNYVVEAWASDNSRVGKLSGPDLDDGLRREPGRSTTLDHPPWNRLRDIHIDQEGRLWVMLFYRRTDWEDLVIEKARPTGELYLEYLQGPGSVFRTRVEVIDIQACAVRASGWFDHPVVGYFLMDDTESGTVAITSLTYSPVGEPFVEVWDIGMGVSRSR
ncbi:MAG: 6-bladed beta-propeller [Gemmatimonadota bacterium]|nr:6-bladed beta-propeller [Gemmatimonadota bacterium]MDE2983727.1 6-bladed beta-propeller [Gemmatimonadota bacterium]